MIRNTMDSRFRGNDAIFGAVGVRRRKRPKASTEKLACGVPGSRKRGRAEKMLKIAGTNSTTPLKSIKASKKRTQNELILDAKKREWTPKRTKYSEREEAEHRKRQCRACIQTHVSNSCLTKGSRAGGIRLISFFERTKRECL